ncbi:MAG: GTPase Era [Deltaproteobacteria bacterium]|nr:GTPase Era [Deltaproteobacteria bacterium]
MPYKSGFVSIIGRPNVGKSTLLNAILGEKIAIISEKPQTTRNKILGVKNLPEGQIVFLDTPGIHRAKGVFNALMVKAALATLKEVDVILYLVEATSPPDGELFIIDSLKKVKTPVILGINKIDLIRKDTLLPLIEGYAKLYPFKEVIPLSALKGDGIDIIIDTIFNLLPEGPRYFPEDVITDLPERFIVAEIIREKVFELTRQEIPYSTAVVVDEFKENPEKGLISIMATIHVERDSQKGIIIGKGGRMLKEIGTRARFDIERLLGSKIYLELYVRVQEDWTEDLRVLKEFGY